MSPNLFCVPCGPIVLVPWVSLCRCHGFLSPLFVFDKSEISNKRYSIWVRYSQLSTQNTLQVFPKRTCTFFEFHLSNIVHFCFNGFIFLNLDFINSVHSHVYIYMYILNCFTILHICFS